MSLNSSKLTKALKVIGIVGWVCAGFILAQAIGLGIIWVLRELGVPLAEVNEIIFTTAANMVVYALALGIIIGIPWGLKKWHTTFEELGIRKIRWIDLLWVLTGFIGYYVLTIVINLTARALVPGADYEQAQETGFSLLATNWEFALAFISLVIIAPVAEELIFRGYLLGKLQKYAPAWLAIVASALVFAVAHGQFNVALDTFALGIILAFVRIKSKGLWAPIVIHALKNAIAFYLLFVNPIFL